MPIRCACGKRLGTAQGLRVDGPHVRNVVLRWQDGPVTPLVHLRCPRCRKLKRAVNAERLVKAAGKAAAKRREVVVGLDV
ncbi:MAG: hypothetical protein WD250_13140 [Egibacteraceae bacterium]